MEALICLGVIIGILLCILLTDSKDEFQIPCIILTILLTLFLCLMAIPIVELNELKKQVDGRHNSDLYNSAYTFGKEDALKKKPYINQYHEQNKSQEEISGYANGYAENYQP